MRHQSDLTPPLGWPGGPCHLVERIIEEVDNPRLERQLVNEVERGNELSNPAASQIYEVEKERGGGGNLFQNMLIGPHAQYRMDLRGVTVPQIRVSLKNFFRAFNEGKAKNSKEYRDMARNWETGDSVKWVDPSLGLTVVFSNQGNGQVKIVTTYWEGVPDPKVGPGTCNITAGYSPPAQDLSGWRTFVPSTDGPEREHATSALPSPPHTRSKPMGTPQFNTPPSSDEALDGHPLHSDKTRTQAKPGEDSPHPDVELTVTPVRRPGLTSAIKGPPYPGMERQREQKGQAKRYFKKYYQRNRNGIKRRMRKWYKKNHNKPQVKKDRERRLDHPERFHRFENGYSTLKERSKDDREKQAALDIWDMPVWFESQQQSAVLHSLDVDQDEAVLLVGSRTITMSLEDLLEEVTPEDESGMDTLFDYLDKALDYQEEQEINKEAGRGPEFKLVRLYHVSPEANIQKFRPVGSPKFGQSGLFVTWNKKSIYRSWAAWVAAKKSLNLRGNPQWVEPAGTYRTLTLYTLLLPQYMVTEAMELFGRMHQEALIKYPDTALAAFGWDVELFLPAHMLSSLEIVGRETLRAQAMATPHKVPSKPPKEEPHPKDPLPLKMYKELKAQVGEVVLSLPREKRQQIAELLTEIRNWDFWPFRESYRTLMDKDKTLSRRRLQLDHQDQQRNLALSMSQLQEKRLAVLALLDGAKKANFYMEKVAPDVEPDQVFNRATPRKRPSDEDQPLPGFEPNNNHEVTENPGSAKVIPWNSDLVNFKGATMRVATKISEIQTQCDPTLLDQAGALQPILKKVDQKNLIWFWDVPGSKGEPYRVKVKAITKGNITYLDKMDVYVSCTCPYWQWQGPEHWAKAEGYLYGKPVGTASSPTVKDPNATHRACKHVLAVFNKLAGLSMFRKKPKQGSLQLSSTEVARRYLTRVASDAHQELTDAVL